MPHVYSTMTNDTVYCTYKSSGEGAPNVIDRQVLIKGGANLATKTLVTPKGAVTEVSDSDLAFLESNPLFQQHKAGGFVRVSNNSMPVEKVAVDMTPKDGSAPKTPSDPKPEAMTINAGSAKKAA